MLSIDRVSKFSTRHFSNDLLVSLVFQVGSQVALLERMQCQQVTVKALVRTASDNSQSAPSRKDSVKSLESLYNQMGCEAAKAHATRDSFDACLEAKTFLSMLK